jgi:alkylated DNA repair dioxygenase AlkB
MMYRITSQQELPGMSRNAGLPVTEGCHYFQSFLSSKQATELLHALWEELSWQQKPIRLFGKEVMQPRLISWHSDPGLRYSYSGLELRPAAWHPQLATLRARLQAELGHDFNSVLVNAYRDGKDSMGWHADDEPELGMEPTLASISLGAERCFRWRDKQTRQSNGMNLQHGSLLLLSGQFQHRYQHCVPKTSKKMGLRINLTFRLIR